MIASSNCNYCNPPNYVPEDSLNYTSIAPENTLYQQNEAFFSGRMVQDQVSSVLLNFFLFDDHIAFTNKANGVISLSRGFEIPTNTSLINRLHERGDITSPIVSFIFDNTKNVAKCFFGGIDSTYFRDGLTEDDITWISMNQKPPYWMALSTGFQFITDFRNMEFYYSQKAVVF